jgi:4-hydroxythreonine-4-phosphate dehydrogenase
MARPSPAIDRPRIVVPFGDPNGIGPEIALEAALDPEVRAAARLVLVADRPVIDFYAERIGRGTEIERLIAAGEVTVDPVEALTGGPEPGAVTADAGQATIAYGKRAIDLVLGGEGEAVVAAPHNESAVAQAGIPFSGYPGLLAEHTGTDPDKVFLMLASPRLRIVHVTLHLSLRAALEAITTERVLDAARAAHRALGMMGIDRPRLAACGLNPHAGEGGLFGDEDERIVRPAVMAAREEGIEIDGPAGADVLLAAGDHDAYLAMYHDQGHIPVKLDGRGNVLGLSIGAPVLFSTVAHGSGHDIAGSGNADPAALAGAIKKVAALLRPEHAR